MSSNILWQITNRQNKSGAIDWNLLLKSLAGGALVGGGLGGGVAFTRYLSHLRDQAARQNSGKSDDTFYIQLPEQQKLASDGGSGDPNNVWNSGGGILAFLAGGGLGYEGIKSLYNNFRMRQVEDEIGRNQTLYLKKLRAGSRLQAGQPVEDVKAASGQFSLPVEVGGGAVALSVLTALSSAVLANKILENKFPAVHKQLVGPKRVMISSQPEPEIEDTTEEKFAATSVNALELLLRLHLQDKAARLSGMADLLVAASEGRCREITTAFSLDPEVGFDLVKNASECATDGPAVNVALSWMATCPEVAPTAGLLAAAEFKAQCPWFCKLASRLDAGLQAALVGFLAGAGELAREQAYEPITGQLTLVKSAEETPKILAPLVFADTAEHFLARHKTEAAKEPTPQDTRKGVDFKVTDHQAANFLKKYKSNLESAVSSSE